MREAFNIRKVIVTNSACQTDTFEPLQQASVKSLSDMLGRVVNRIHDNRAVRALSQSPSLEDCI